MATTVTQPYADSTTNRFPVALHVPDPYRLPTRPTGKTRPKKPISIAGVASKGPRFEAKLAFSIDGSSFSEPLAAPKPNTIYQVQFSFSQHNVEPLLNGITLHWIKPAYWTWVDGFGVWTYEELIANPTLISRKIKSPSLAHLRSTGFKVLVTRLFQ